MKLTQERLIKQIKSLDFQIKSFEIEIKSKKMYLDDLKKKRQHIKNLLNKEIK